MIMQIHAIVLTFVIQSMNIEKWHKPNAALMEIFTIHRTRLKVLAVMIRTAMDF